MSWITQNVGIPRSVFIHDTGVSTHNLINIHQQRGFKLYFMCVMENPKGLNIVGSGNNSFPLSYLIYHNQPNRLGVNELMCKPTQFSKKQMTPNTKFDTPTATTRKTSQRNKFQKHKLTDIWGTVHIQSKRTARIRCWECMSIFHWKYN